jgi:hypothetical protein
MTGARKGEVKGGGLGRALLWGLWIAVIPFVVLPVMANAALGLAFGATVTGALPVLASAIAICAGLTLAFWFMAPKARARR